MTSDLTHDEDLAEGLARGFNSYRRATGAAVGWLVSCAEQASDSVIVLLDSDLHPRILSPGIPLPLSGLVTEALATAQVRLSNRPTGRDAPSSLTDQCSALENVLWAPLVVGGAIVGALGLANKPGGFDERDAELAQAYADVAAPVLLCNGCVDGAPDRLPASAFGGGNAAVLVVELVGGQIADANPAAASFYGYPEDELRTLTLEDLSATKGFCLADSLAQLHAGGDPHLTTRHCLHDGTVRTVELYPAMVMEGGGVVYCLVHDITDRLEAEAAREGRERFETLLTALSRGFAGAPLEQTDALVHGALQRTAEVLGADRASLYEFETEVSLTLVHCYVAPGVEGTSPPRIARWQAPWLAEQLTAGRAVALGSLDHFPPEAKTDREHMAPYWIGSHALVPLHCNGELIGVLSCGLTNGQPAWEDIGLDTLSLLAVPFGGMLARRQAHQALAERLRFEEVVTELATVFASTSPVELERALDGLLDGMARLLDCDRAVIGRLDAATGDLTLDHVLCLRPDLTPLPDGFPSTDSAHWRIARLLAGEAVATSTGGYQPDESAAEGPALHERGGARLCLPIRVDGQVSHMLGFETIERGRAWPEALIRRVRVVADLIGKAIERQRTEAAARELRDRLAHVARVLATGELAAAFAHELNQPLTAIISNTRAAARFLARENPDLENLLTILTDVTNEALRAGNIIAHMRSQLRRSVPRTEPVDLCAAVGEVAEVLASEAVARRVDLHIVPSAVPAVIAGDRVQIQQVVVNLVMNAFDAVGDQPAGSRRVSVHCYRDGDMAVSAVEDTGHGLPSSRPESVFDPFVTTKPGGLGLGLSISRSIAAAHGGSLSATSRDGSGSRFELRLPLLDPPE
ncbi:GAF domain-containing protein [bacterium]|nr:GAF domain-containing protein [bacterium]